MEQKIATLNCVAINQQQTEMNSSTDNDGEHSFRTSVSKVFSTHATDNNALLRCIIIYYIATFIRRGQILMHTH